MSSMAGSIQSQSTRTYTFRSQRDISTKKWPIIVKSVEVILCILCIIFIDDPAQSSMVRSMIRLNLFVSPRIICLCYGTYIAYLIYSTIYLAGKLIGDEWPWKTMAALSSIATVLFVICGGFLLKYYADIGRTTYWPNVSSGERFNSSTPMTVWLLLVTGILSVVTAIVHLIEAILLFWFCRK